MGLKKNKAIHLRIALFKGLILLQRSGVRVGSWLG